MGRSVLVFLMGMEGRGTMSWTGCSSDCPKQSPAVAAQKAAGAIPRVWRRLSSVHSKPSSKTRPWRLAHPAQPPWSPCARRPRRLCRMRETPRTCLRGGLAVNRGKPPPNPRNSSRSLLSCNSGRLLGAVAAATSPRHRAPSFHAHQEHQNRSPHRPALGRSIDLAWASQAGLDYNRRACRLPLPLREVSTS